MWRILKTAGWLTLGSVAIFGGFVGIRITEMRQEDIEHRRLVEVMRGPPGPLIPASAEDCAMFRAIAVEHFQAQAVPVPSEMLSFGRQGPLGRGSLRLFEGVSGQTKSDFPKERWDQPRNRYRVVCNWGRAGLVRWPKAPSDEPDPQCPADLSFTLGTQMRERAFPCRGRPAGTGLPHIGFYKPLVAAGGRYALVETFVWYGILGANGYICLLEHREAAWRVAACKSTWIS